MRRCHASNFKTIRLFTSFPPQHGCFCCMIVNAILIIFCFCSRFRSDCHGGWNVGTICLLDKFSGTFRSMCDWKWRWFTCISVLTGIACHQLGTKTVPFSEAVVVLGMSTRTLLPDRQKITKWVCQTHVILTKMLRKEWHAQFDKFSTFS